MRRNISRVLLYVILGFLLNSAAFSQENQNKEMVGVMKALESVVNECIQYALISTSELQNGLSSGEFSKLPEADQKEFLLSNHNSLLKTCLQVSAIKLNEAAEGVGSN